jgi:hypothetical protein
MRCFSVDIFFEKNWVVGRNQGDFSDLGVEMTFNFRSRDVKKVHSMIGAGKSP